MDLPLANKEMEGVISDSIIDIINYLLLNQSYSSDNIYKQFSFSKNSDNEKIFIVLSYENYKKQFISRGCESLSETNC